MNFIDKIAIHLLTLFSTFFATPVIQHENWTIRQNWLKVDSGYEFIAESESIIEKCKLNPNFFVQFPIIFSGAHVISLDYHRIVTYGDPSHASAQTTYGSPQLKCSEILDGSLLTWHAYEQTKFLSTLLEMPYVTPKPTLYALFTDSLNLIAAGGVIFIGIFTLTIFWGKISQQLNLSLSFSCFFYSIYFISVVPGLLNLPGSAIHFQRWCCYGLFLGSLFYLNYLRLRKFFGWQVLAPYSLITALGIGCMYIAKTGDGVQFGIFIPLGPGVLILSGCIAQEVRKWLIGRFSRIDAFQLISFLLFVISIINDVLFCTRILNNFPIFSLGIVGGILFSALSINEQITQTHNERDQLRVGLSDLKLKQQKQEFEIERANEFSQLALQVAHDIRSPIAALSVLAPTLRQSSEKENLILKTVI